MHYKRIRYTIKEHASIPAIALVALFCASGCATLSDPRVPESIRSHVEPLQGTEYLLYRPSAYDRSAAWPLIVVCHGGFPDSPTRQMRDWTQLAERFGFLVAVPNLALRHKGFIADQAGPAARLDHLRRRLLSVVQHVRAGQTISDDRIFMCGMGSGTDIALYTALGAPETFRAIALSEPRFSSEPFDSMRTGVDPYQPVLVRHASAGILTGTHGQRCIDWLRGQHVDVQTAPVSPDRSIDAEQVVEFFESVIRTKPWVRVEAIGVDNGDPMTVRFTTKSTCHPGSHRWDFGDGDTSSVAEPIHRFTEAGSYRVTVTLVDPTGAELTRFIDVSLPRVPIESISEGM